MPHSLLTLGRVSISIDHANGVLVIIRNALSRFSGFTAYCALVVLLVLFGTATGTTVLLLRVVLEGAGAVVLLAATVFIIADALCGWATWYVALLCLPSVRTVDVRSGVCEIRVFGVRYQRHLSTNGSYELVVSPLYHRGAWGYTISIQDQERKRFLLVSGGLVGDEPQARAEAEEQCVALAALIPSITWRFAEDAWTSNRSR